MRLIYADAEGKFYDHPTLRPVGRSGDIFVEMLPDDLIELPEGASLVMIPEGTPVGVTPGGRFVPVDVGCGGVSGPARAVAALLPQGYTRTMLPAYRRPRDAYPLPLLGYTAVAWQRGKVWVAAQETDVPDRWNPARYDTPELPALVEKLLCRLPDNRIVRRLAGCALEYSCFTAQNIFYSRWEGGIPVSRTCNAGCLGCISLQPAECCPSPQSRIDFTPSVGEVVELACSHLEQAEGAVISFGQGCEGEPSLARELLGEALLEIRNKTARGTINMNTNAGNTDNIGELYRSGLDSIRVSLISAREEIYNAYHQPRGYSLDNVRSSIALAGQMGLYTSLNLLVSPGLTDREEEVKALLDLISETGVKMVQLRNLNIDPDLLNTRLPPARGEIIGIPGLIEVLRSVPGLTVGNFSKPVK